MKCKSLCTPKEMFSKLNRPPTEWEKISAIYTSNKRLITKIYRELKKLSSPNINDPVKKWASELKHKIFKRRSPSGQKTYEELLAIPVLKGNENQKQTKFYLTLVRIATNKNTTNNKCL
jgi:hypothetical protein